MIDERTFIVNAGDDAIATRDRDFTLKTFERPDSGKIRLGSELFDGHPLLALLCGRPDITGHDRRDVKDRGKPLAGNNHAGRHHNRWKSMPADDEFSRRT